jgi:hypothetical protein
MLTTILLVFAFVLFILAALGVPLPPRFNLIAAGLAFWVASVLFGGYTHTGWH